MSTRPASVEQARVEEDDLLARLGLDRGASDDQLEAAHEAIAEFLLVAPASLQAWAAERLAEADEAFVLLRGPRRNGAGAGADILSEAAEAPQPVPARRSPARPAARPAMRPAPSPAPRPDNGHVAKNHVRASMLGDALGGGGWFEDEREPEPERDAAPRARRGSTARRQVVSRRKDRLEVSETPVMSRRGLRRVGVAAGVLVAVGALLFAGYKLGEPTVPGLTGTPVPQTAAGSVDQAQVTALMTRLAADANDVEALQGLANLYFAAGDFATAGVWLDKLLAVEPENVTALLGAGAAAYNLGELDEAEAAWQKVVELDPDNVEAYYDLGFLYLAQEPPDMARVEAAWRKVIELDPDSDIAKTVAAHLGSIVSIPSASPAPSPQGSPEG